MPAESGSAAGIAFFKLYGFKAGIAMLGAALLYFVLPPVRPDGKFDEREFVLRLAAAGLFSTCFGDLGIDLANHFVPFVDWAKHTGAIYLVVGAPGWWVSRAVALFFHNRRDRDAKQIVEEFQK